MAAPRRHVKRPADFDNYLLTTLLANPGITPRQVHEQQPWNPPAALWRIQARIGMIRKANMQIRSELECTVRPEKMPARGAKNTARWTSEEIDIVTDLVAAKGYKPRAKIGRTDLTALTAKLPGRSQNGVLQMVYKVNKRERARLGLAGKEELEEDEEEDAEEDEDEEGEDEDGGHDADADASGGGVAADSDETETVDFRNQKAKTGGRMDSIREIESEATVLFAAGVLMALYAQDHTLAANPVS